MLKKLSRNYIRNKNCQNEMCLRNETVPDCLFMPHSATKDTEVLKEPRGFIRCLQWLFALVAFATCANFSTSCGYTVKCTKGGLDPIVVEHPIYYPFK